MTGLEDKYIIKNNKRLRYDSRPTASSPESYYYMQLLTGANVTQWDNKWKLMGDFDGVPATYTIYLTADQPYTHSIVK